MALQRHLGPLAEVGNTQIRLSIDGDGNWERTLVERISRITEFHDLVAERAAALS